MGLKEAKELVEKAPVVLKTGVTKEEAEAIAARLKEVGATIALVGVGASIKRSHLYAIFMLFIGCVQLGNWSNTFNANFICSSETIP